MSCFANRFEVTPRFGAMIGLADSGVESAWGKKQFDCSECPHVRVCVLLVCLETVVDQIIVRFSMSQRSEPVFRKYVDLQFLRRCGTLRWIAGLRNSANMRVLSQDYI